MEQNIGRVLKKYKVKNEMELSKMLITMPKKYREIFEAKWGLDNIGSYCTTYILLAEKLNRSYEEVKAEYMLAEEAFWYTRKLLVVLFCKNTMKKVFS